MGLGLAAHPRLAGRHAGAAVNLLARPVDLTPALVERVAFDREPLRLHPDLLAGIDAGRAAMLATLAGSARVYGVNTGMGYLAETDLSADEQARHQRTLLLGRAVGSAPWLPAEEARAVLVARLAGFVSGHAGVSAALCAYLADRLNDGFDPAVPALAMGSAGEVIPLAHAFQAFLGIGAVLTPSGGTQDAAEALAERGVAPYEPAAKEGIALLAGAPATAALALARGRAVRALRRQLLVSTAAAVSALQAPLDPYDPALSALDADPLLAAVLAGLRDALAGSEHASAAHQAPVSFRVAPQVLAHVDREAARLDAGVRHALITVTDSPVHLDGRFLAYGGFHAVQLAADMDALAVALVRAAELAGQRVARLLDSRFSGLPDQLSAQPGPYCGLIVVHKRVVGAVNELRRLAVPASVGLADTSLGQEDAMTFAFEAAAKLRRVEALTREVMACELLCARQAWALRGVRPPQMAGRLEAEIAPVGADRPLGQDLAHLVDLLERDQLFDPEPVSPPPAW